MNGIRIKKKILTAVISLILTALTAFAFPACTLDVLFGTNGVKPNDGHEHSYTESVIPPTCSEKGYTLHKCSLCGYSFADTYVDEIPHTPEQVEAVEPTYISAGYTAGTRCKVCDTVLEGCELIPVKGYDEFVPRLGNSAYGYYDYLNGAKTQEKQSFYIQLHIACEEFCNYTKDVGPEKAQFSDGKEIIYYPVKEIDVTDSNLTNDELTLIWKTFYVENPLYYWLANNTMIITSTSSSHEVSKMFVLMLDETYVDYEERLKFNGDISEMTEECAAFLSGGMTGAQKAAAIHRYLAGKIDYAYKSDGVTPEDEIWAHNITGASSKGKGVCETYAKTYLYLCLVNNVNCIMVTGDGYSGSGWEEHAWNYIEINGKWYGVDVTWDDQVVLRTKYMGASKTTMSVDHNAGKCYYTKLPELSQTALDFEH